MKRIAFIAAALLLAAPVHAATFSVGDSSAPGGDFSNANSPSMFNIGTATAGNSEAYGNLSGECDTFDCNGVGPDSQDSFFITIGVTEVIASTPETSTSLSCSTKRGAGTGSSGGLAGLVALRPRRPAASWSPSSRRGARACAS